jgi:hypothetical protein
MPMFSNQIMAIWDFKERLPQDEMFLLVFLSKKCCQFVNI